MNLARWVSPYVFDSGLNVMTVLPQALALSPMMLFKA
jgi:hypothetical protein